ncbi:protein TolQ [Erythrobacter sp. EhN03]|uniref:protein TolQ n=1 Tax=Qipengyuania flava TaxID=192812 RepID=UPI0007F4960D|nr:protein TolQ [Pseudomonadota bacterium]MEC8771629.1 protein TolQ [Pseudomonadota bacterium]OAN86335.1 protein TolQ [Erythrobacter sp. EhN03]
MSSLTLMAAAAPTRLDPIRLFLDADIVVQLVMAGLLLASVWVWMIIVSFSLRMAKLRSRTIEYENEFWQADSFDRFTSERGNKDVPAARVAQAAVGEYRRSTKGAVRDPEALRGRIATAMDSQIALEADDIAERLNFLATVGSVAPFVGLFGTVWGIMNSFFQIGAQESSSLAVVAPGISEALFATAIGLFAAIPAVIAYNRFSHRVDRYEARLQRFADKLNATFSRQLETR